MDGWIAIRILGFWLVLSGITGWVLATWFRWLRDRG